MMLETATACAPGSVGNLGPGLDCLGLALDGAGDTVEIRRSDRPGLRLVAPGHPDLPADPARHSATIAAAAVLRRARVAEGFGADVRVTKGLPLAGGQGGSAASAAAGAAAMNALLGLPLTAHALVEAALEAESAVAGRHADNVAPAVLGGLVLVRSLDPLDLQVLPVPDRLRVVLAHPNQQLRTAEGRAALPSRIPLATSVHQAAQVGAMVAGACLGDLALLGRAIDDRVAEPARIPLLPGFARAKAAALAAGALGCSISGSGPTSFALVDSDQAGRKVSQAMVAAYRADGVEATVRVAAVDRLGVRVR